MLNYYKPSGKVALIAYMYFALAIGIIIPIFAITYTYLISNNTFIFINFFASMLFGFAIGKTIIFIVKIGKVRNQIVATIMTIVAAIVGIYIHWISWIINVYGESIIDVELVKTFINNPIKLYTAIADISTNGTWSVNKYTPKGFVLIYIWIIEALSIIGIAILMSSRIARKPFNEKIGKWHKPKELMRYAYIDDVVKFYSDINNQDTQSFEYITRIKYKYVKKGNNYSKFILYETEQDYNYLKIYNITAKRTKKGNIIENKEEVIKYVMVGNRLLNIIYKAPYKEDTIHVME